MDEKTFSTSYGKIHYWINRICSDGMWLVFLPGLTADHRLFEKQLEGLGKKFNCFTWDAPAHGISRPYALRFSMEDMARYLHEIFLKEGIRMPILVGQSMGGCLSQVYMERFPEAAAGFISIDSCPMKRRYYSAWELIWLKHTKRMYLSIPWKLLIRWGTKGNAESESGRKLMRRMMEVYKRKEFCELAAYGFRIMADAIEENRSYALNCPALLLCGEKDAAGSVKRYNRQWEKQEGHTLIWLPQAGHNSNTDAPDEVNRIIEAFAASIRV